MPYTLEATRGTVVLTLYFYKDSFMYDFLFYTNHNTETRYEENENDTHLLLNRFQPQTEYNEECFELLRRMQNSGSPIFPSYLLFGSSIPFQIYFADKKLLFQKED